MTQADKNFIETCKEILEKYHEGLIALSACLAGNVNREILKDNIEEAEKIALWHKNLFGEDLKKGILCALIFPILLLIGMFLKKET